MKSTSRSFFKPNCIVASALFCAANGAMTIPSHAQSPRKSGANTVKVLEGKVQFTTPDGYRALSKSEIARKFPSAGAPQYVWAGDKNLSVTIALTHAQMRVKPDELDVLKAAMEKNFQTNEKGLQWLRRDFINLAGRRWIRFEFTSDALDTRIYNDLYFTSFEDRLLLFNFNSTQSQRERVLPIFKKSRDSIVLRSSGKS